jgi:hypothetical protein
MLLWHDQNRNSATHCQSIFYINQQEITEHRLPTLYSYLAVKASTSAHLSWIGSAYFSIRVNHPQFTNNVVHQE